jgi:hypothetical protein
MRCSDCGNNLSVSRARNSAVLYYCDQCDYLFYFDGKREELVRIGGRFREDIPPIKEGTKVIINNVEHKLFLEFGTVVQRSHKFYRIQFDSLDGIGMWVHAHWVDELPRELCL